MKTSFLAWGISKHFHNNFFALSLALKQCLRNLVIAYAPFSKKNSRILQAVINIAFFAVQLTTPPALFGQNCIAVERSSLFKGINAENAFLAKNMRN